MAGFWFLVSVVLTIILLSGRDKKNDAYAAGYQKGYQTFGGLLQDLIASGRTDVESLWQLIRMGKDDSLTAPAAITERTDPTEAQFMTDAYGEEAEPFDDSRLDNRPVATPAPVFQPLAAETPEQKAQRSLRNLNVILYTASFLLVAAGALFVASTSTAMVKLIGVCLIIAIFYGAGFIIYTKVERLRPAGLAFLGTGLALIPFAGFALADFSHLSATASWFVTSLVGLVAYFAAAIRLQSQLVSYLTMAFVLSLVSSTTAMGATAIVWQFVAIIGVALLASIVAYVRPDWVPAVFRKPVEQTGQVVTPVALLASLTVFNHLHSVDYEVVFAVATLHYVVAWLQTRTVTYETIIRLLSYVVVGLLVWDIFSRDIAITAFSMAMMMTFQHAYSLIMVRRPGRAVIERIWIGSLFGFQLFMWPFWSLYPHAALLTTIALFVIGLTSYAAALRLRSVGAGIVGLGISLVLPFVIARQLFTTPLSWWVLTAWFMMAAAAGLWLYARYRQRSTKLRLFMTAAYLCYLFLALVTAGLDGGQVLIMVTYFATAAFIFAASYIARAPYAQLAMPLFVLLGTGLAAGLLVINPTWRFIGIGTSTAAIFWLLGYLHATLQQPLRQLLMVASGQVVLLAITGTIIHMDPVANKTVVALLLVAGFGSLALRWLYRQTQSLFSGVFACSYPVYFMVALLIALSAGTGWTALVTGLGAVLFLLASYVERAPSVQLAASFLTVITLGLTAQLIGLSYEWRHLFTFGIAAALFYGAAGLHHAYAQPTRKLLMTATAHATLFLIILTGTTGSYAATLTTYVIMLVWAVLSLALRWWCRDRSRPYALLFQTAYPVYYFATLLLMLALSPLWTVVTLAAGAAIFWLASYAERAPLVIIIGNAFLAVALMYFWWWAELSVAWMVLGIAWILAGLFYFGYWIFSGLRDELRSQALLWSTWLVLLYASLMQMFAGSLQIAATATFLAFAITLGIEGVMRRRHGMVELAVYMATFGMQRIVELLWPQVNIVLYAHWWAVVLILVAVWSRTHRQTRLIIAGGIVTFISGIYALTQGTGYQLLFLIEHLALLVAGALLSRSWAIWWGISATAVAILYFLRNYTFLLLGFLGLLLIAIVVWRLMRSSTNNR